MADIAEIGFRANTGELADAKMKMEQLVPAAGKAERAANRLNTMMEAGSRAALASARADVQKANAVLSAAKASDTATRSEIAAAAAAKRKAQATYDAAKAANAANAASKAAAAAAKQEAVAVDQAAAARKRYTSVPSVGSRFNDTPAGGMGPWGPRGGTANDNVAQSAGAMKANVGNIAAQFQDIGVTAAMGMNPLLIALQQGTQLSAVLAGSGGLGAVKGALLSLISPVSLVTIGLVALTAAGLQMVDWVSLAQSVMNGLASILPQVAIGIAAVGAALAIAFAPAILTIFWNLFLTIAAGIVGAVGMIVASVGAIPIAIGLIIADLYIFRDEWAQILGFDIVDAAKRGANLIIGSFVAAYHDIEFLWQNFPNIIGAAAIGAANMVIKAVNAIVSASVSAINKLIAMVDKLGTSSIMQNLGMGFEIGQFAEGAGEFAPLANDAADALASAVKDRNAQLQEDLTKDYLGAMGGAITEGAEWAADKLKKFSAGLGENDKKKKKKGGKTEGERFEDIVRGAERTIATLQAEKDALGQSAEATARLKYETELLNKAQQANINLTPQQREQLMQLAGQMATLEVETARAKEAMDFSKDLTKGFLNDFIQGVKNGESVWKSFGQAALNVLDKIGQKLVDMAVDGLFSGGSGGGGFLGKLFGGLFGGGFKVTPGAGLFAKGGAFAGGISGHSNTVVDRPTLFAFASGAGVMGEAGPEAIMPLKRGPDGSLGVQMHNTNGTGNNGPISNQVTINNEYRLEGVVSEAAMVRRIEQTAEQTQEQVKKNMVGWLDQYSQDGAFA